MTATNPSGGARPAMTDDLMALVRRAEAACDDFDRGMDAHADAGERPDLWGQSVEFPVSDLRAMANAVAALTARAETAERERDEAQRREIAAINDFAVMKRDHDVMRRERDEARAALAAAQDRLFDLYLGDDGQAWDEAGKYLAQHRPDLSARAALAAAQAENEDD